MTALAAKKVVGAPFSNAKELVRVRYNYADDGGATGTYDILQADGELLVTGMHAVVKSACSSGGSMTLDVGKTGGDQYLVTSMAVASLTANAVIRPQQTFTASGTADTDVVPFRLADGEKVTMGIAAATLTGGTIEFVLEVCKA